MRTNLKGDRYDTMAAEILESVAVRVDLHPLRGHQRQNLQDAIASRLRYEIEGAADQRTSVTESLLAAERERAEKAEAACLRLITALADVESASDAREQWDIFKIAHEALAREETTK